MVRASNIGGLGTVAASLANLIAVRLAKAGIKRYHGVALCSAVFARLPSLVFSTFTRV